MKSNLSRLVLAVIIVGSALGALATSGIPANAQSSTSTPAPTATPRPRCPAGTIDVNGNGVDDGDCENLDAIARPDNCIAWPNILTREGYVECGLPWNVGGRLVSLMNSVGCTDVSRLPYPRAIVNLPVEMSIYALMLPSRLGYADGQPGSYRYSNEAWTVEGLYLHERYPFVTQDRYGRNAFDTRVLLGSDSHKYPSINNVRAYLKFRMLTTPGDIRWTSDGFAFTQTGGLTPDEVQLIFKKASFPLPGQESQYSPYGPDLWGVNRLPGFKLNIRTRWQLVLVTEWDNYIVDANNAYVLGSHEGYVVPIGQPFQSYRAWSSQQQTNNTGDIFCNAAQGYIPLPVIEGQSVLKP